MKTKDLFIKVSDSEYEATINGFHLRVHRTKSGMWRWEVVGISQLKLSVFGLYMRKVPAMIAAVESATEWTKRVLEKKVEELPRHPAAAGIKYHVSDFQHFGKKVVELNSSELLMTIYLKTTVPKVSKTSPAHNRIWKLLEERWATSSPAMLTPTSKKG